MTRLLYAGTRRLSISFKSAGEPLLGVLGNQALWAAARALKEDAAFSRRVALTSLSDIQDSLEEKEEFQAAQAETIRRTLLALYGTGGDRAQQGAAEAAAPLEE